MALSACSPHALGCILIIHIEASELINALGPCFGEEVVKIFAGLAEKFVGAVTQPQHRELEAVQLAKLAFFKLLEQIDGALRRFTLPVSAHYHQQVALFLELLGFVVGHRRKGDGEAAGLGLRLDGSGDPFGVACLGAVENGQAAAGRSHGGAGSNVLVTALGEAVEISAHPGQLLGIEGREYLAQLTLLLVREGGEVEWGILQLHHTRLPWSDFWPD